MTTEAWHSQSKKGFLVQRRRGFLYVCVCAHPTRHCSAIPLSPWHAAAFTNPHCRTERAWLCIPNREGERQTATASERGRQGARNRESEEQRGGCCNTGRQRARDEREDAPLPLSPSLLVCTSAVGLSSRLAERVTALQFIQRDSPSPGFPCWGRWGGRSGAGGGQVAADAWQSGGAAEALGFVLITVLTSSKNGRRIDWSSGSVSDVKGWGPGLRTQRILRAELE